MQQDEYDVSDEEMDEADSDVDSEEYYSERSELDEVVEEEPADEDDLEDSVCFPPNSPFCAPSNTLLP